MTNPNEQWAYGEPTPDGDVTVTMTRAEAVAWMRKHLGGRYPVDVTDEELFSEWVVVNWAWRVDAEGAR